MQSPEAFLGYLAITKKDTGHLLPREMRIVDYDKEFGELIGIDVNEEGSADASQYCLPPEALLMFVQPFEEDVYRRDPVAFLSEPDELQASPTRQDRVPEAGQ